MRSRPWLLITLVFLVMMAAAPAAFAVSEISTAPSTWDFGNTCVPLTKTINIHSNSASTLTIDAITVTSDFSVGNFFHEALGLVTLPVTLQPNGIIGDEMNFDVTFSPTIGGYQSGTITILFTPDGGVQAPLSMIVEGTSDRTLAWSMPATYFDGSYQFGSLCPGETATQTLQLNNNGSCGDVTLGAPGITVAGANFSAPPETTFVIHQGDTLDVPITYTAGSGASNDVAVITVNSNGTPISFSVEGSTNNSHLTAALPDSGNFGDVCLGSFQDMYLTLQADGCGSVSITSIVPSDTDFVVTGVPNSIAKGESVQVPVRFSPTSLGAHFGNLVITHSAPTPGSTTSVPVTGWADAGALQIISAAAGNFGEVCPGTTANLDIVLKNSGLCPIKITSVTLPANGGGFLYTPQNLIGTSIDAGQILPVQLTSNPTATGTFGGQLIVGWETVAEPDSTGSASLDITVTAQPAALKAYMSNNGDFGTVCVGDSQTATLTIKNDGGCTAVIDSWGGLGGSSRFSIPDLGTTTIEANGSIDIPVTFEPLLPGTTSNNNLTVGWHTQGATLDEPSSFIVSFTGSSPTVSVSAWIADSGNFGNVCIGSEKDLDLTVKNNGGCEVTVSSLMLAGPDAGFFLPSDLTSFTLAPNAQVIVPVRYSPTAVTTPDIAVDNAITVNWYPTADVNDIHHAPIVELRGESPAGNLTGPTAINFGNVCVGNSTEQQISVCNDGTCPLKIVSVAQDGADCGQFLIINAPVATNVAPGSCRLITVRFSPTSVGDKTCKLQVNVDLDGDGDADATKEITLNGTGLPVSVGTPANIVFPPTVVNTLGDCPTIKPLTIVNNGTCPVTITSVALPPGTDYEILNLPALPVTLQPGEHLGDGTLQVAFRPSTIERTINAEITVQWVSNSPGPEDFATATINLCGEGVNTGARVTVTEFGTRVPKVERLQIQRINANRNRKIIDTVSTIQNVNETHFDNCSDGQTWFHWEYGGKFNQIQLLPGSYQVTATIITNGGLGKRKSRSVGFNVDTCTFNPNVVINFP